jgi:hypothetical protein
MRRPCLLLTLLVDADAVGTNRKEQFKGMPDSTILVPQFIPPPETAEQFRTYLEEAAALIFSNSNEPSTLRDGQRREIQEAEIRV